MKISETEMEIMKIIWDKNGKVTTSELADKMPDKKLTTISTLAGRLIDKGCLKSEKIGRSHVSRIRSDYFRTGISGNANKRICKVYLPRKCKKPYFSSFQR